MIESKQHTAIVIGTSAGGLEVLSHLLRELPKQFPIPIIVVQHRSTSHPNLLEEVLQNKCSIMIHQVEEKEPIKPGIVYTAPPDYHLLIERDFTFSLSSDEKVCYSRPSIDVLFESAAIAYQEKLIAVILSGANNDGASGIRKVREFGGCSIAQDPNEAMYSTMPQMAIDTGCVDFVMKMNEIISFILLKGKTDSL